MRIIHSATGESFPVVVVPVEEGDFKRLTKKRYFFDWKREKGLEIYKLCKVHSSDILGLVSIERIPEEWRMHIRLLTVSRENQGGEKEFGHIAGNLITHIAKMAVKEFGELACVSLKPKDAIRQHYMDTYHMDRTGLTLSVDIRGIRRLINTYDHE